MDPEMLRVGDAERDEVTSALHEHFAQGRLDREELDERLAATLSARTAGDLRTVVRDLPGTAATAAVSPGPWGRGGHHREARELAGHGGWGDGTEPLDGPLAYGWGHGPGYGPLTHGWGHGHGPLAHGWGGHGHGPRARRWGHGPGGDAIAHGWGHDAGPYGWGPRRGKPFGLVLLAVVITAAVTGWWMVFPFLAVMWFGGAFLMRNVRRRHHAAPHGG